jgi:uncharacterized short protein YbdD (DUF466 family)
MLADVRRRSNRPASVVESAGLAVTGRRLAVSLAGAAAALRRVLGAPDYERYLEHARRRHPEVTPLSKEAYLRDALARRYDRPGSRCC